ncbi:hypothetical protein QTP88_007437 [Uroleucon formosanum]
MFYNIIVFKSIDASGENNNSYRALRIGEDKFPERIRTTRCGRAGEIMVGRMAKVCESNGFSAYIYIKSQKTGYACGETECRTPGGCLDNFDERMARGNCEIFAT